MENIISVIISAYNVEKYITKCIKSLQDQTYKNIEIIIVDDGSIDKTADIVKAFCNRDKRIIYKYQANAGPGPARNKGIQIAQGNWIMFVDADDWVDISIVKKLYDTAVRENVDLVCCGYTDVMYEGDELKRRIDRIPLKMILRTAQECHDNYMDLLQSEVLSPPTRKIYKRNIIQSNNIEFPDLRRSEDVVFNYRYFRHVNSCAILSESLYFYRIVGQYNVKIEPDYYQTIKHIYSELGELHKDWGYQKSDAQYRKIYNYCENLVMLSIEANFLRGELIEEMLSDQIIKTIIRKSSPDKFFNVIMKKCALSMDIHFLKSIVKLRIRMRTAKRMLGR